VDRKAQAIANSMGKKRRKTTVLDKPKKEGKKKASAKGSCRKPDLTLARKEKDNQKVGNSWVSYQEEKVDWTRRRKKWFLKPIESHTVTYKSKSTGWSQLVITGHRATATRRPRNPASAHPDGERSDSLTIG